MTIIRIRRMIQTGSSLRSIAHSARSIQFIKKANNRRVYGKESRTTCY